MWKSTRQKNITLIKSNTECFISTLLLRFNVLSALWKIKKPRSQTHRLWENSSLLNWATDSPVYSMSLRADESHDAGERSWFTPLQSGPRSSVTTTCHHSTPKDKLQASPALLNTIPQITFPASTIYNLHNWTRVAEEDSTGMNHPRLCVHLQMLSFHYVYIELITSQWVWTQI